MRLSGILFIIVGAVVALFSWLQGSKMTLFIFVGVAILVYGVWKVFMDRDAPSEADMRRKHHEELAKQLPQGQRHHHDIPRICSVCKTRNHPRSHFCGHCGNRL